jgi:hypothetical protein
VRVVHTEEGSANIVQRGTDQTRKRDNDWCLTRANDFVVNEKTEGRIPEHGGNVTGDANGSQAGKDTESRKFANGFGECSRLSAFWNAHKTVLPNSRWGQRANWERMSSSRCLPFGPKSCLSEADNSTT